ncbi:LADA_0B10792g1_1 [Lachancea dasiensis]|uniref:LADA_0B10792g1_1 n=1 Tax=Lachancea dasiensis TaxID=1072105 RepID=A0A1G4IW25_9SACH|nr:LADA_0B10792g1_1 [Lachancea dasiensis]
MEPICSERRQNGVLSRSFEALSILKVGIKGDHKFDDQLIADILGLERQWIILKGFLEANFNLDCSSGEILGKFEWMRRLKNDFYRLYQEVRTIEEYLLALLDRIESQVMAELREATLSDLVDAFERCWQGLHDLKRVLQSSKYLLETGLEFNEILNDHLLSIGTLIDENAEKCFEIRRSLKAGSMGRNSRQSVGSEKRVSSVLSASATSGFSFIPTFPENSDLFADFMSVAEIMDPLEKSMTKVVDEKIQGFGKRVIHSIAYLTNILQQHFEDVNRKHEALVVIYSLLKNEMLNSQWKELFGSLNRVLLQAITEVEDMLSSTGESEPEENSKAQRLNSERLSSLEKEIEHNFNIVYQALSASVLTVEVATEANTLASRWLELVPKLHNFVSKDQTTTDLSSDLKNLSLESTQTPVITPPRPQRRVSGMGTFLSKRMNIKPVIVNNTPKSVEKSNHFSYQADEIKPISLSFHKTKGSQPLFNNEKHKNIATSLQSHSRALSARASFAVLMIKIAHYSRIPSRIPVFSGSVALGTRINGKLNDPIKVVLKSTGQIGVHGRPEKCQLPVISSHKRQLN